MDVDNNKELFDLDAVIDYAQLAFHTLKNSATEIMNLCQVFRHIFLRFFIIFSFVFKGFSHIV